MLGFGAERVSRLGVAVSEIGSADLAVGDGLRGVVRVVAEVAPMRTCVVRLVALWNMGSWGHHGREHRASIRVESRRVGDGIG